MLRSYACLPSHSNSVRLPSISDNFAACRCRTDRGLPAPSVGVFSMEQAQFLGQVLQLCAGDGTTDRRPATAHMRVAACLWKYVRSKSIWRRGAKTLARLRCDLFAIRPKWSRPDDPPAVVLSKPLICKQGAFRDIMESYPRSGCCSQRCRLTPR